MTGIFIPWNPDSTRTQSRWVGWIDDGSGCHIWTGALSGGYPVVKPEHGSRVVTRIRYEREVGPIPDGMHLDHFLMPGRCSKSCCNPAHLRPVTPRENNLRGNTFGAELIARTHCIRGGHPLSGENLYQRKNGQRKCRTCTRELQKAQYRANKHEARKREASKKVKVGQSVADIFASIAARGTAR